MTETLQGRQIDFDTALRYQELEIRVLAALEEALPEGHGRHAVEGDKHYKSLAWGQLLELGCLQDDGPRYTDRIAKLGAIVLAWLDMRRYRAVQADPSGCDHHPCSGRNGPANAWCAASGWRRDRRWAPGRSSSRHTTATSEP